MSGPGVGHLGLGSNVGDRRANLAAAAGALPEHGVQVLASSSVYVTEPVGLITDQPSLPNLGICATLPATSPPTLTMSNG